MLLVGGGPGVVVTSSRAERTSARTGTINISPTIHNCCIVQKRGQRERKMANTFDGLLVREGIFATCAVFDVDVSPKAGVSYLGIKAAPRAL